MVSDSLEDRCDTLSAADAHRDQGVAALHAVPIEDERKFLLDRTDRLNHWIRNGGRVLPIIQRILGQ